MNSRNWIRPRALRPGATLAVVSPVGAAGVRSPASEVGSDATSVGSEEASDVVSSLAADVPSSSVVVTAGAVSLVAGGVVVFGVVGGICGEIGVTPGGWFPGNTPPVSGAASPC